MYCPVTMFLLSIIFNVIPHILVYSVISNNLNMSFKERIERLKTVFVALLMFKSYQIVTRQMHADEINKNNICFIPFYEENVCLVDTFT